MTGHDNQMDSDLRMIDEVLERGTATAPGALERELEELVLELAADAPQPDPAFAARLGERVGHGFPRPSRLRTPKLRIPSLRRPPMAALAGAASVLLALVVVVSLQGGENEQPLVPLSGGGGAEQAAPEYTIERATPSPAIERLTQSAPGTSADSSRPFAPGREDRRIERSASLTLAAPDDRLERVANEIIATTDRYGGFVLSSSVSSGEQAASAGDFELRIPAGRLQAALRDLSRLGDVRARTQAGEDITREFVSAGDRIRAARAERRGLLARLESADTDVQAEAIRRRLDIVAAEVNGLRGQLRGLRLRSDYATVSVELQRTGEDDGSAPGAERDGLGGALDDAVDSLSASIELLVRTLGVALAPALLAALAWFGLRLARRHRREAALG